MKKDTKKKGKSKQTEPKHQIPAQFKTKQKPGSFKGAGFRGKKSHPQVGFNPARFKVQHKG